MHVLIIENKRDVTSSLNTFLQDKGHVVDRVGSDISNRQIAQAVKYDVIVIGVTSPKADGIGLYSRLRAGGCRDNPILMILVPDEPDDGSSWGLRVDEIGLQIESMKSRKKSAGRGIVQLVRALQ